jgi:sugar lactone lactonase YvrE
MRLPLWRLVWTVACFAVLVGQTMLAAAQPAPVLTGVMSRKVHGAAGTFDLPLALAPDNPTTEPRQGPAQTVVFAFDKPVTGGGVSLIEGVATVGTVTFSGSEMIVPLVGVANLQYVTVAVTNVIAADGGTGGSGSVRVGFLAADANRNRVVTLSDLGQINAQIAQFVTDANFLMDVNASGTLSVADKAIANALVTKALPPPPAPMGPPPELAVGISGVIERVVVDPINLQRIDGLAFDRFGNLFGALEVVSGEGGLVYIDKATGAVRSIALGIPGACRIDVHPNGDIYVSSELPIVNFNGVDIQLGGVYRVVVTYDGTNRPVSGVATRLAAVVSSPEGIQPLQVDSAYGSAGDMLIAEDETGGRIVRIMPDGSALTVLVGAGNLQKPEGLAFGDFNGAQSPALYAAEKAGGRIVRVGSDGSITTLGDPTTLGPGGLNGPDNINFGLDGYLYVGEKYAGRVIRIAGNGTHTVFAAGFDNNEGLAFDPENGDLYVGEIEKATVWRIRH